jgi:hypothetical protein
MSSEILSLTHSSKPEKSKPAPRPGNDQTKSIHQISKQKIKYELQQFSREVTFL